jgi:hypothetical protein
MSQEIIVTESQAIATLIIILALLGTNVTLAISIASLIQRLRQAQERIRQLEQRQ